VLGALMLVFLLSLTGIPPLAGFWAKVFVIEPALEAGGALTALAVLIVLNAAAAAFYYLRVAVYMYMREPRTEAERLSHGRLLWAGLAAAFLLTVAVGLFPTTLIDAAATAAQALPQGITQASN